jgi:hypothetical protein
MRCQKPRLNLSTTRVPVIPSRTDGAARGSSSYEQLGGSTGRSSSEGQLVGEARRVNW